MVVVDVLDVLVAVARVVVFAVAKHSTRNVTYQIPNITVKNPFTE